MKNFYAVVLLALICGFSSAAKRRPDSGKVPYRFEVNAGYATFPLFDAMRYSDFGPDEYFEYSWPSYSVGSLYADYSGPEYITGVISAEFNVRFKKWFALGTQLNFDSVVRHTYSSMTGARTGNTNCYMFSLVPYARFTYLNKPLVYMYSSIGLGVSMALEPYYMTIYPAFQIVPVGVAVGKRLYGFFEIGAGTVYVGCKVGIGYRF